ncbi:TIM barrel protein [uncultured Sphingomonas sp.]|uniref:TIM barrel protein n=1 Tax=uncultured Sphingomonas sp. TaxID=158754 RepID=UPI0035C9F868
MFFSVNTFMWTDCFTEQHLPLLARIKAIGADGVEIACSRLNDLPVASIRAELNRLGLDCTLSASPPSPEQSPIHHDPDARRSAITWLRQAIETAGRLGATTLAGPLYAHVGWFTGERPNAAQLGWAVEAFAAVGPDLDAAGVDLAIEPMNRFESFFLPTAAEGVRLCEAVGHPRVGLLLDVAHMAIEEKDPLAAIRIAGPWLKHMQTSETDRGTPGTGRMIDWPGLFRTLATIGYQGGCAIESFPFQVPELAGATWSWRDFADSPDALAREGIAFLRRTHHRVTAARTLQNSVHSIAMIDLHAAPAEQGSALLARHAALLTDVTGCERAEIIRQAPPMANHFALLTTWRSEEDRDRHLTGDESGRFRCSLQPLLASPVDERIYRKMSS